MSSAAYLLNAELDRAETLTYHSVDLSVASYLHNA